jgi:glycosyltransferase involved in cell wall biosynthesis
MQARKILTQSVWAADRIVEKYGADRYLFSESTARGVLSMRDLTEARRRTSMPPEVTGLSVSVVGFLSAHLGLGEAARNLCSALDSVGVTALKIDISPYFDVLRGNFLPSTGGKSAAPPRVAIIVCGADSIAEIRDLTASQTEGTYRIGLIFWESTEIPSYLSKEFGFFNEIWAPSEFIESLIRPHTDLKIFRMPISFEMPDFFCDGNFVMNSCSDVKEDEFLFLNQFDVRSSVSRKNPQGVIEAFKIAFKAEEAVRLVIKTINMTHYPDVAADLAARAQGHRISFVDRSLDHLDRFRLLAAADCFVSLHRAEGFGLSIAEAMAYGVPVVATGWSGNLDFTSTENSALVGYDLVLTSLADGPYPAGSMWAEPRVEDAAKQMRRIHDDPAWRSALGKAGRVTVRANHSAARVGTIMRARLEWLAQADPGSSAPISKSRRRVQLGQIFNRKRMAIWGNSLNVIYGDFIRDPSFYFSRLGYGLALLRDIGPKLLARRLLLLAIRRRRDSHTQ